MKVGLFLGRFQPFHLGHLEVIKRYKKEVGELVIVIGSSQQSRTKENPFTDSEREEMINETLIKEGLTDFSIVPVPDIPEDSKYVKHVERALKDPFHVVIAAENKTTADLFSKAGYKTITCERIDDYSSTKVRELMQKDSTWKKLVPKEVAEIIEDINGVQMIKDINSGKKRSFSD
jgi:nicotinamide-nucleotide adenylyltransferase